jgi:hypothetical protein
MILYRAMSSQRTDPTGVAAAASESGLVRALGLHNGWLTCVVTGWMLAKLLLDSGRELTEGACTIHC